MRQIRLTEARLRGMILEATRRAIMMEERGEETDSKIRELISFLHNAQKPVREIHWNTNE